MLTEQRHQIICDEIAAKGQVASGDLAARFAVSEDTIRRDLRTLAKAGQCRRVYGGAVAPYAGPITTRQDHQAEEKGRLAAMSAGLLQAGDTVLIDAGSTNVAIAAAISPTLPLTVGTNSLAVAAALADRPNISLILFGGAFDRETGALIGPDTVQAISRVSADMAFLGSCGLDVDRGITAFDQDEIAVKQAMIAATQRLVIAATAEKLGATASFRVDGADVIHDLVIAKDAASLGGPFQATGTKVHLA